MGRAGETLACDFLRSRGYRILARNVRYPVGELDIVATDGGAIVFVEVRTRTSVDHNEIWETVTVAKQRRVIRAALHYLRDHPQPGRRLRFDVVTVLWSGRASEEPIITHYEDAFGTD